MSLRILGLGTAQPSAAIRQTDAADAAASLCCHTPSQRRLLHTVYRQSRIRQRGCVLLNGQDDSHGDGRGDRHAPGDQHRQALHAFYPLPDDTATRGPSVEQRMNAYVHHVLPLARAAADEALAEAGIDPGEIAQLVTVSCTGFAAPGIDIRLIGALGLPADVGRTMIGFMGCHGAINGLRVAHALAHAQPGQPVLLCAVELCSLHFQYGWDTQRVVANALFADGAAAVVAIADGQGEDHGNGRNPPTAGPWRVRATGSCVLPDSRDAMTWTIGDHGFEMTLSPRVPDLIEAHLPDWLDRWLGAHGLTVTDVGSWAIHPGGPRVVDAVEEALSLPAGAGDVSRHVLADCGNMSSPTVLFILDRLRRAGAPHPCVALAFGPGVTAEAALLG